MYKIHTLNKISSRGLNLLPREEFETASEILNPDAIIVRSASMHDMEIPQSVLAIARAGAGYNNIPVDACTEKGIIVFNTPGANANGVKELVLAGMFLAARNIFPAMTWVQTLKNRGGEVSTLVEDKKAAFTGPEISGKKLGVIGLGAIGAMVANDALALGMEVVGYDPFISVEAAWGLSKDVKRARSLDSLLAEVDYVTLHVPLADNTRGLFNKERFSAMKKGITILNFARGGLVNNQDLLAAAEQGIVKTYVTDFPEDELLGQANVLAIPHLGASTPEAEENCAIMAVKQIKNFLEYGNIKNSVNFPNCEMDMNGGSRIIIANKNIPNMVGQITTVLAKHNINISDMLNKHRDEYAYNIIDIDGPVGEAVISELQTIPGVVMVRLINQKTEL